MATQPNEDSAGPDFRLMEGTGEPEPRDRKGQDEEWMGWPTRKLKAATMADDLGRV